MLREYRLQSAPGLTLTFYRPPLKSAAVFGGIAGIMAGERGDIEDVGSMCL